MPVAIINIGNAPTSGTTESLRSAVSKINSNFALKLDVNGDAGSLTLGGKAFGNAATASIGLTSGTVAAGEVVAALQTTVSAAALTGRRALSDASYTALISDVYIGFTALTASRTITLPAASAYKPGQPLYIADESGACSSGTPIVIAAQGSDTIAGQATVMMVGGYQKLTFHTNGTNLWTFG